MGKQPICNSLKENARSFDETFPLETFRCLECLHIQIGIAVDPKILFSNYPYRTGVSETLRNYYGNLAENCSKLIKDKEKDSVNILDIGCNDCTLLSCFTALGYTNTYGVDPYEPPDRKPIREFINEPWQRGVTDNKFDLITATNVLAHNDSPKQFLVGCASHLKDNGFIVLEFPYSFDLIRFVQFDTIYHEHISYFNAHSVLKLVEGTGLEIISATATGVHGGSLRIVLQKERKSKRINAANCSSIEKLIESELYSGIIHEDMYESFQWKADGIVRQIKDILAHQKLKLGRSVVGFGASAKGSVFLNYAKIDFLSAVIDETECKIGKLIPGVNIPIISLNDIDSAAIGDSVFLIMSWNCMEESVSKLKKVRHDESTYEFADKYLTYQPIIRLRNLKQG